MKTYCENLYNELKIGDELFLYDLPCCVYKIIYIDSQWVRMISTDAEENEGKIDEYYCTRKDMIQNLRKITGRA